MTSDAHPKTLECHCMHDAIRYYKRCFVNVLNIKVIRVFYKCTNCRSRIFCDYMPDVDYSVVNVFDLLKQHK